MRQLVDRVMAEATVAISKGKMVRKVALYTLDLFVKLLYTMLEDALKGFNKGAFKQKALLGMQFASNWNRGYL